MNKKVIIPIALFIILVSIILFLNKKDNVVENSQIILFYGDGCPHCEIVDEYINENNIEDKAPFIRKEVYNNKENTDELVLKAEACGIPTESIGIPFLWDGSKCYVGDKEIIEFFKSKAGL